MSTLDRITLLLFILGALVWFFPAEACGVFALVFF
jgi:uncharacterized membrane protein YuzA (DUF378 family)